MFNKNKVSAENFSAGRSMAPASGSSFSVIGADVQITGDLKASNDLHIDGAVTGDVVCASLVQGACSVIKGAVKAESAKLGGRVEGSIEAVNLVVEASARILGDVTYGDIRVENGGVIEGPLKQMSNNVAQLEPHTSDLAASAG